MQSRSGFSVVQVIVVLAFVVVGVGIMVMLISRQRENALRAQCEARLKDAQARIEKISLGPDGRPSGTEAFDGG